MDMLHHYIVAEILYRVPLRCVREIKCVCKQWHAIISDPLFFKLHYQINNGVCNTEILAFRWAENGCLRPSSIDFENRVSFDVSDLDFPLIQSPTANFDMVGSCNGLVCLLINETLVFWNPCRNQYRKIAKSDEFPQHSYSFGYDSAHDDYKVVLFHSDSQLKIYSLNSNTRSSSGSGYSFSHYHPGIYLNGSSHYVCHNPDELIAFSLAEEKLGDTVPKPDGFDVDVLQISVLDDCFCVCRDNSMFDAIEIWVMKEYMVKGSWSKLYTLS